MAQEQMRHFAVHWQHHNHVWERMHASVPWGSFSRQH